jgi:hypothetical protein
VSKSFSIGATYVTDLNAPTALVKDLSIPGQPEIAVDNDGRFFWRHRDSFIGERVRGAGVDAELKVYKWEMLDVKVYADYSHLFLPGVPEENVAAFSDGGFTVGGLLRMSIGERYARKLAEEDEDTLAGVMPRELRADHAFRFRLEARTFGPQYLPSYFNTLYEVDRLQFGGLGGNRAALPTKIGALAANAGQPWRAGFYLEGSYTFVDVLGVTALYEDAYALGAGNVVGGRNFALHVESAGLGWLQLFASYHFRNFDSIAGLFSFSTDNEIFFAGGRLMILPILWLNVTGQRAFRVGFGDNDGGVRKLPGQGAGTPSFRFSSIGMQNQWAGTVELELGWQF